MIYNLKYFLSCLFVRGSPQVAPVWHAVIYYVRAQLVLCLLPRIALLCAALEPEPPSGRHKELGDNEVVLNVER